MNVKTSVEMFLSQIGGGSVMIWFAFSYFGWFLIADINRKQNSDAFCASFDCYTLLSVNILILNHIIL